MAFYDRALPPSLLTTSISSSSQFKVGDIDFSRPTFGIDTAGQFNSVANALTGVGALAPTGWTFITAPQDVSWNIANQSTRIDMFGTNKPPVVAGTKGMRDLSLNDSLVEGFIRGVTVEGKLAALEKLTNYKETLNDGFVNVPVYQVWANEKSYGNGYYIIKDVRIKESMRDLRGDATRAYVDISFMEVPEYQVNSGRDLASAPATAAKSNILPSARDIANPQRGVAGQVDGKSQSDVNNPANRAGPNGGGVAQPAKKPPDVISPAGVRRDGRVVAAPNIRPSWG